MESIGQILAGLDPSVFKQKDRFMAVGIDAGKKTCGVAIVPADITPDRPLKPCKAFYINNNWQGFNQMLGEVLEEQDRLNVMPVFVIEASNVYWKPIYWHLFKQGALIRTVNGVQTKRARTTGSRKNRDDLVDARAAATVFLMGNAHHTKFPEPLWADLRELERMLIFLDKFTSGLKNRMRTSLYQTFPEFEEVFPNNTVSSPTTLHLLKEGLSSPQRLMETSFDDLTQCLKKGSRGRIGSERAVQLKDLAETSFGIPRGSNGRSTALRFGAQLLEFIDKTITQPLMRDIEKILNNIEEAQWLTTIDGVGIKTAAIFLGELGNPAWFQRTNQVVAWFGWDPSSSRSANYKRLINRISKAGSKYGRYGMFNCALSWMLHCRPIRELYNSLKANGKSHDDAVTVIAAKLTRTCWAIVRDQKPFNVAML